jgi:hypothetical protein
MASAPRVMRQCPDPAIKHIPLCVDAAALPTLPSMGGTVPRDDLVSDPPELLWVSGELE